MSREAKLSNDPPEDTDEESQNPSPSSVTPTPPPLMHRDASMESKEGFGEKSYSKDSDDEDVTEKSSIPSEDAESELHKALAQKDSLESKSSFGDKMDAKDEDEFVKISYVQSEESATGMEGSDVSSEASVGTSSTEGSFSLDTNEIDNLIEQLESLKVASGKPSTSDKDIKAKCKLFAGRVMQVIATHSEDESEDEPDDELYDGFWNEDPFADPGENFEEVKDLCWYILDDYRTYVLNAERLNASNALQPDTEVMDTVFQNMREISEDMNDKCAGILQMPSQLSASKNVFALIRNLSVQVDSDTEKVLRSIDRNHLTSLYNGFAAFQKQYLEKLDACKVALETDLENLCAFVSDMRVFCEETARLRLTIDTWSKRTLPTSYIESWKKGMKYLAITAQSLLVSFTKIRLNLDRNMSECCKYRKVISKNLSVFLGSEIENLFHKLPPHCPTV